ncbi:glutathione peroxidase [Haloferula sargassicola]|uniref:Glutathione peroxidase n=1 Tax=Haloferula sargassicola TaxID=490096 RepID=A0ABP9UKG3_9BACT
MKRLLSLVAALALPAAAADLTEIPFNTIDGKATSLADYKGKVVMVVNTASKCGLTPQYEALEKIYEKYKDRGFVILGFPCNDFASQEPGTADEIKTFCKTKYDVTFPLMEKVHVRGQDQHPLYATLTHEKGLFPGDVSWNFGKFIISKDGEAVARFDPRTKPDDPEVIAAIEKQLK